MTSKATSYTNVLSLQTNDIIIADTAEDETVGKAIQIGETVNIEVQARVNKLVEDSKPKEGWIKENNKWHYYKNNKKLTGLQYLEYNKQKNWYYFDANGVMQTGKVTITATFDSSGKLVS